MRTLAACLIVAAATVPGCSPEQMAIGTTEWARPPSGGYNLRLADSGVLVDMISPEAGQRNIRVTEPSGAVRWISETDPLFGGAFELDDEGNVYILRSPGPDLPGGEVAKLSAASGSVEWSRPIDFPIGAARFVFSPIDKLWVVENSDAETARWKRYGPDGTILAGGEMPSVQPGAIVPLASGGIVYGTGYRGSLIAIDGFAAVLWRADLTFDGAVSYDDGSVVVFTSDTGRNALVRFGSTHEREWSLPLQSFYTVSAAGNGLVLSYSLGLGGYPLPSSAVELLDSAGQTLERELFAGKVSVVPSRTHARYLLWAEDDDVDLHDFDTPHSDSGVIASRKLP